MFIRTHKMSPNIWFVGEPDILVKQVLSWRSVPYSKATVRCVKVLTWLSVVAACILVPVTLFLQLDTTLLYVSAALVVTMLILWAWFIWRTELARGCKRHFTIERGRPFVIEDNSVMYQLFVRSKTKAEGKKKWIDLVIAEYYRIGSQSAPWNEQWFVDPDRRVEWRAFKVHLMNGIDVGPVYSRLVADIERRAQEARTSALRLE